ncbi:SDR family NAD(P)-dependent oxidoreductase [Streptomyces sp. NPDC021218]|uniref:SDR family NAD(P)-dependent oxidoreductase n=1 Tax=Streptomyces sp. NPDC021218 TaxID=3365119 RepID=UPI00379E9654
MLVNVASMAAYFPVPNMAVYGAAKAFVLSVVSGRLNSCHGHGVQHRSVTLGARRAVGWRGVCETYLEPFGTLRPRA